VVASVGKTMSVPKVDRAGRSSDPRVVSSIGESVVSSVEVASSVTVLDSSVVLTSS